jgi:hypothetical protein
MNAGSGYYEEIKGSPAIFIEEAESHRANFTAVMSEIDDCGCRDLSDYIQCETNEDAIRIAKSMLTDSNIIGCRIGTGNITIVCNEDNKKTLSSVETFYLRKDVKIPFGIIYIDPNNHQGRFKEIESFFNHKKFNKLDILIHISATSIKRVRKHNIAQEIDNAIKNINKKCWLIRRPYSAWQWTFLLGTNWNAFPDFDKQGFVSLDSKEGKLCLEVLCKTKEELLQTYDTETIQSIYLTPPSKLSGLQL